MKKILLFALFAMMGASAFSQEPNTPVSQMEQLDRGLVAIPGSSGKCFVSWRLLGTDDENTTFEVLKNGNPIKSNIYQTTSFMAAAGKDDVFQVATYQNGQKVDVTPEVKPWAQGYLRIPLNRPEKLDGKEYYPNDCSVGDVDGDGQYEIFLKWDPENSKDNANTGYSNPVIIDCYKLDGTQLWRVNLGINIRAGAHYTQFLVYDFNGDGRAELICKTAQGTVDGQGNYANKAADDTKISSANNSLKYANSSGRVLSGAEYLTVFEGTTGRAIHTVWYNPNRGCTTGEVKAPSQAELNKLWGDDYGNRCDRFLACVAHLDGADQNASAVMCRGYYTRAYLWAVDFDGEKLSTKWLHASVSPTVVELTDQQGSTTSQTYSTNTSGIASGTTDKHFYCTAYGQGCHSVSVGDVDGDGCDEIIFGSAAIDNDGSLLHTTGLGHGDALHLSDLMPDRPGLEVMMVHEEAPFGWSVRDAHTGELLIHHTGNEDTGRGIAADINASHRGFEYWHSDDFNTTQNIYSSADEVVGHFEKDHPFYNFRIYWDGDAYDDLFDKGAINNGKWSRLLTCGNYGDAATYGSKATPVLSADILGDWREEVILFDKTDSASINLFSTTTATKLRVPTLMHDHVYRMSVAWQNVGYNQPPHLGYYLPDYVASRFEVIGEGQKEQSIELGQPITDIVCRLKNCTSALLQYVYLDGVRIKSFSAPEGMSFKMNSADRTFTLSGTPAEAGDYEFQVRSSGDVSGTTLVDTLRIHVGDLSGISEALYDNQGVMNDEVYDLQGRPIISTTAKRGQIVIIRRGDKTFKAVK